LTRDDVIHRSRVQLFALAGELGNVKEACRVFGVHRSTYYRWRRQVLTWGLEALRPRERRPPRMPNQIPSHIEQRIVAFCLAYPGFGPKRISAELARERWGGIAVSPNGVHRVLRRHGLGTRRARLALVAGYAAPPEPDRPQPEPERHLQAEGPGDLVQLDCFCVGRLSGTRGTVWQYTGIDVVSGFCWAELHATERNPRQPFASALARRIGADLAAHGWVLRAISTDNGSEFRNGEFTATVTFFGAVHRLIRAGRPTSNGAVERVQRTILEECWRPSFARSLVPKLTALVRDLDSYLEYYNYDRAHTGRHTKGRTPAQVLGARKMRPR
jgi:transposase InsO family protein